MNHHVRSPLAFASSDGRLLFIRRASTARRCIPTISFVSRMTCTMRLASGSDWPRDRLSSVVRRAVHWSSDVDLDKEAHKVFDEVIISVKSGQGGNGEIVEHNRGRMVDNFKYKPGGSSAKRIWLPASNPGEGSDGADVLLVCDPEYDNLLHLHKKKSYSGRDGSGANPNTGSGGPKKNKDIRKARTPPLIIPVPPGTVVKRKSNGALLGELINPGDSLLVAKGGKGGGGVKAPSREANQRDLNRQYKIAAETGAEIVAVEDNNWKVETRGMPGQQLSLQLILRVVADIGIVGFPNAGKSSLLAAMTRASPEVAAYPFTTLMPNLGVMASDGGEVAGAGASSGGKGGVQRPRSPILADLPGLIEGAHKGKGLGRMFLRHLRRTSALLHVVDAAAADPATDYLAVREELRMYNPEYCCRPHVVALNKMDLEDAGGLRAELQDAILGTADRLGQDWDGDVTGRQQEGGRPTRPSAIVPCSAQTGEGLPELQRALRRTLEERAAAAAPSAPRGPNAAQSLAVGVSGSTPSSSSQQTSVSGLGSKKLGRSTDADSTPAGDVPLGGSEEEVAADEMLSDEERFLLGLSEEQLAELSEGSPVSGSGSGSEGSRSGDSVPPVNIENSGTSRAVVGRLSSFAARRARALAATASSPPGYTYVDTDEGEAGLREVAAHGDEEDFSSRVDTGLPEGGNGDDSTEEGAEDGEGGVLSEAEAWLMDLSEAELLDLVREVEGEEEEGER